MLFAGRDVSIQGNFIAAICLITICLFGSLLNCQVVPTSSSTDTRVAEPSKPRNVITSVLKDQGAIWSSPVRVQKQDAIWLLPAGGFTAGLIMADRELSPANPVRFSLRASDAGVAAEMSAAALLYGIGKMNNAPHARETGALAYRAAASSLIVSQALSATIGRERPDQAIGQGDFLSGGSSFPSSHAAVAWSIASVFAHEYPGWGTKVLVYGTATGVSVARVAGRKHFASDVFVGSTVGWLIGREVYRLNHDVMLPGESWGTFKKVPEYLPDPRQKPSTYVPVDSWIYPLLDRIAEHDRVNIGFFGLRPWTRLQCAEIVATMDSTVEADSSGYQALTREFTPEILLLRGKERAIFEIESLYSRVTSVSGEPLTDSYHFGQTITNDFGRPYGAGLSNITGFSARTVAAPVAIYVRGEFQHGPAIPAYGDSIRGVIADMDQNPVQAAQPSTATNDFRIIEAYAAFNVKSLQFTLGKQNLWWGPGESGAVLMSNNAEPIYMMRVSNMQPIQIPGLSKLMGPARGEFFFGELSGHRFPAAPWIHGQKISFKPTANLELGFSRTVIFSGEGRPLTFRSFWNSFASVGDKVTTIPGSASDVGDRRGGFDFRYRVPGLRKWLVIYSDAFTEDDPSPLSAPQRAGMIPGVYMARLPKLPKLDFRAEGVFTDQSEITKYRGTFFYYNGAYHDAYTNKNNILGSWVGRQGHGLQLSSNYWLAPRRRIQLVYRRAMVDEKFVSGGGRINDFKVNSEFEITSNLSIAGTVQYERWRFPVLSDSPQSNFAASWQLTYQPHWKFNLSHAGK
jgi:membrane-associated phospholipid phosphatase